MDQAEKERQDEVIVGLMATVDKAVNNYLRKFPRYRYLQDDFVGEGYADLTHIVRRLPPETHSEPYIYRTTLNAIYRVIRTDGAILYPKGFPESKKLQRVPLNHVPESELAYTEEGPAEYLKLPTHRLTENQIEILELIRKGLSFNAAAEVLSVEPGTARKRHQRAIERLREYYEDSTSDILFGEE